MYGPVCACGTFAVGLCKECSRPICGTHSGMWEIVRLCGDHYREKRTEWDGRLQREQQARSAAIEERMAKERQERQRAQEERPARIAEARNQIPALLARLRASRVPRERLKVYVKGKYRWREGWLLFTGSREGFMGSYSVHYHVTTEGEFIKDNDLGPKWLKNQEAIAKMISGDHPPQWEWVYDWAKIVDRLRELLSGSS